MLEVKVENCAEIDVGKKFLAVCVLAGPVDRKPVAEVRRFGTSVKELERLRASTPEPKVRGSNPLGRIEESTGYRHPRRPESRLGLVLCRFYFFRIETIFRFKPVVSAHPN